MAAIDVLLPTCNRLASLIMTLCGVAALGHYDRPEVARGLGWDAEGIVARGRTLRRDEGRA